MHVLTVMSYRLWGMRVFSLRLRVGQACLLEKNRPSFHMAFLPALNTTGSREVWPGPFYNQHQPHLLIKMCVIYLPHLPIVEAVLTACGLSLPWENHFYWGILRKQESMSSWFITFYFNSEWLCTAKMQFQTCTLYIRHFPPLTYIHFRLILNIDLHI